MNVTAFGRVMSKKFRKERTATGVVYFGVRLKNVPSGSSSGMREPPAGRFDPHEPWPEELP